MRNTGNCRRPCAPPAVLLKVAIPGCSGALAADPSLRIDAPESLAVAAIIDFENLIELYQSALDSKIVGARHNDVYTQGSVGTSYNQMLAGTGRKSPAKPARNKDQDMVFYCNGSAADASIAAIQIASACDYERPFWFGGGLAEWEDKDYPCVIE